MHAYEGACHSAAGAAAHTLVQVKASGPWLDRALQWADKAISLAPTLDAKREEGQMPQPKVCASARARPLAYHTCMHGGMLSPLVRQGRQGQLLGSPVGWSLNTYVMQWPARPLRAAGISPAILAATKERCVRGWSKHPRTQRAPAAGWLSGLHRCAAPHAPSAQHAP